jgi:hypothetical protein
MHHSGAGGFMKKIIADAIREKCTKKRAPKRPSDS